MLQRITVIARNRRAVAITVVMIVAVRMSVLSLPLFILLFVKVCHVSHMVVQYIFHSRLLTIMPLIGNVILFSNFFMRIKFFFFPFLQTLEMSQFLAISGYFIVWQLNAYHPFKNDIELVAHFVVIYDILALLVTFIFQIFSQILKVLLFKHYELFEEFDFLEEFCQLIHRMGASMGFAQNFSYAFEIYGLFGLNSFIFTNQLISLFVLLFLECASIIATVRVINFILL